MNNEKLVVVSVFFSVCYRKCVCFMCMWVFFCFIFDCVFWIVCVSFVRVVVLVYEVWNYLVECKFVIKVFVCKFFKVCDSIWCSFRIKFKFNFVIIF